MIDVTCWGRSIAAMIRPAQPEKGSVTIENVIWAIAVIAIAAVVVAAITAYVSSQSAALLGP